MRMILACLAICAFAPAPAFANRHEGDAEMAAEATDASEIAAADEAAIADVVQAYFDGIGAADANRLNRAFAADKASMVGVMKSDEGEKLMAWKDMGAVIANWADDPNPEGVGRDGEILDMKVMDGRIAMVMFRYKDEFYDVLSLAKVGGEWKIIAKAFILQ
ncbi:MAG: hypothetical protein GC152_09215 [Alphaproteobacteria bacterium]|nr:hypothetical protein [Alphaproteobacteria bacterium]